MYLTYASVPPPGPPSGVLLKTHGDIISVSWSPPSHYSLDHVTSYVIRYSVMPYSVTTAVRMSKRSQMFPITTRNHKGQLYHVTLSAFSKSQEGDIAGPFYVRAGMSPFLGQHYLFRSHEL